jgi:hypothetical protein
LYQELQGLWHERLDVKYFFTVDDLCSRTLRDLVGWLAGWLVGWLVGWLGGCFISYIKLFI